MCAAQRFGIFRTLSTTVYSMTARKCWPSCTAVAILVFGNSALRITCPTDLRPTSGMNMSLRNFNCQHRAVISAALVLMLLPAQLIAADTATKKTAPTPNLAAFFKQHWLDLVKSYREQNKKGYPEKNVVLLGDSITEGFNVEKYFPDRHVLNRGIGADIIGNKLPESDNRGILRRMDESVFDCNPSDVFLL